MQKYFLSLLVHAAAPAEGQVTGGEVAEVERNSIGVGICSPPDTMSQGPLEKWSF